MGFQLGRRDFFAVVAGGALALAAGRVPVAAAGESRGVAPTPPMGWNSWDCFGASVREEEVKANADYMATHLRRFGWEYVVVDIQWYEPTADGSHYHQFAKLDMDPYGRLVPAVNRFPSTANGQGFKPLAKYCHDRGLKFGIHILRGIPRQAVEAKTPVLGTTLTAADIADTQSTCAWNTDMYGVDPSKDGAQAWYDSLIQQYHDWGVDFLKIDDLTRPYDAHRAEIDLIRRALDKRGPQIVFSGSPGETPLAEDAHVESHLNMWRLSDDFWDRWRDLHHAFALSARWQGHAGPGHWPDLDMLPLGHLALRSDETGPRNRQTRFTRDEQVTLMTLWCMARSPLMFGGHLPDNDPWTLSLMTNGDVLDILKRSRHNRQVSQQGEQVVWAAEGPGKTRYAALFNLGDQPAPITVALRDLDAPESCAARDLWANKDLGRVQGTLSATVPPHGAHLVRLS